MERYIILRILLGLFLLFAAIFLIIRLASSDGPSDPERSVVAEDAFVLAEQDNAASKVVFTIVGKINASEDHREVRFTINQETRLVEILGGYDGKVIKSTKLSNTNNSYREFLEAINNAGYTTVRKEPKVSDPRGVCSNGKQYLYDAFVDNEVKSSLWSTSCNSYGTSRANRASVRSLFERQFPEYRDFIRGTKL